MEIQPPAVESVVLYGFECWTLMPTQQRSLDGRYTGMLRAVLNVKQSEHVTDRHLYGERPNRSRPVTATDTTSFPPANWYWTLIARASYTNVREHTKERYGCAKILANLQDAWKIGMAGDLVGRPV